MRGERLGPGEPAFVKRVEGKGQYEVVELLPYPESWSANA